MSLPIALVFREIDPWTSPVSGGTFDPNPSAPDRKCRVIVGPVPLFPCSLKKLCENRNGRNVPNSLRFLETVCPRLSRCISSFFRLAGFADCQRPVAWAGPEETNVTNLAFRGTYITVSTLIQRGAR